MSVREKITQEGITFDDVLLVPAYSAITPDRVSLQTQLTRNIGLKIPILSAAMDTVTEHELAIALAHQGGMGIIHKNLTIERQAAEVNRVKRYESGVITNPITLDKDSVLGNAFAIMKEYRISGLPVVEPDGTLIGIITNRDLKYEREMSRPVADYMTKEALITSKEGITIAEAKEILLKNRIEKLPIVDGYFKLKGLITIKDIDNLAEYPDACKDGKGRLRVGAAIGVGDSALERAKALIRAGVDILSIDSAHGHSAGVIDTVRKIKATFPEIDLIGGNIVTAEAAQALIEAGVDAVKVGVGPGSICTTRVVAGVGMPQLTAIGNVCEYCEGKEIGVISDGGIKHAGDIVKAIAAGAHCAMLGNLLAGTDEAPGEEIIYNGRKFKTYAGMGSLAAMRRGSKDRYFQGGSEAKKLVPEGIEARVPYKGKLADIVYQLNGGLRSGMGYCGTASIADLIQNGKFVKITQSGLMESHPHDVNITREAPNYQR